MPHIQPSISDPSAASFGSAPQATFPPSGARSADPVGRDHVVGGDGVTFEMRSQPSESDFAISRVSQPNLPVSRSAISEDFPDPESIPTIAKTCDPKEMLGNQKKLDDAMNRRAHEILNERHKDNWGHIRSPEEFQQARNQAMREFLVESGLVPDSFDISKLFDGAGFGIQLESKTLRGFQQEIDKHLARAFETSLIQARAQANLARGAGTGFAKAMDRLSRTQFTPNWVRSGLGMPPAAVDEYGEKITSEHMFCVFVPPSHNFNEFLAGQVGLASSRALGVLGQAVESSGRINQEIAQHCSGQGEKGLEQVRQWFDGRASDFSIKPADESGNGESFSIRANNSDLISQVEASFADLKGEWSSLVHKSMHDDVPLASRFTIEQNSFEELFCRAKELYDSSLLPHSSDSDEERQHVSEVLMKLAERSSIPDAAKQSLDLLSNGIGLDRAAKQVETAFNSLANKINSASGEENQVARMVQLSVRGGNDRQRGSSDRPDLSYKPFAQWIHAVRHLDKYLEDREAKITIEQSV